MSTILESLQCAEVNVGNITKIGTFIIPIVTEQIHSAVALMEKGYDGETDIDELVERHGSVEAVPERKYL